jgi:hypothetical protein
MRFMSQDSSVGTAIGYGLRAKVRFLAGGRDLYSGEYRPVLGFTSLLYDKHHRLLLGWV